MTTSLERLFELMPAPLHPAPITSDWPSVEARLGVEYPQSVRALFDQYGAGIIRGGLRLYDPRWHNSAEFDDFMQVNLEVIEAARADDLLAEERPEHVPPYPALGHGDPALIPLAENGNADVIMLVVSNGQVQESPLYVANLRNDWWMQYPGSMPDLILETVTGGAPAVVELLGEEMWALRPEFDPYA